MKTFTIDDIRSWKPCYDPSRYLPKDWSGTPLDILKMDEIPGEDRLWVVLRKDLIEERTLQLFALSCARQIQHLMEDERSVSVLDITERYLKGEASKEELKETRYATNAAYAAYAAACAADFNTALISAKQAQVNKLIEMLEDK